MPHPLRERALDIVVDVLTRLVRDLPCESAYLVWRSGAPIAVRGRPAGAVPVSALLTPRALSRARRHEVVRHRHGARSEAILLSFGLTRELVVLVFSSAQLLRRMRPAFDKSCRGLRERLVRLLQRPGGWGRTPPDPDEGGPSWPPMPASPRRWN